MSVDKVGIGIVGCGVISEIYMKNISDKFNITKLVACSDLDEERMKQSALKYGIKAMKYEDMLNDDEVHLIINLTNPVAHYSLTKQALEHGKNVYSEKMISVSIEEGRELVKIANERNLYLGAAPDTFLGGSIQTSRYIVESGLIGEPLSAIISINRNFRVFGDIFPHMHKSGGTVAYDLGCYYITALVSIFGPVKEITAFARIYEPNRISLRVDKPWFDQKIHIEDENIITSVLRLDNDMLVTVHFNAESIQDENPHVEIYGTEGILYMGDPNNFDSLVYIQKPMGEKIQFPFTHGYLKNSRGVGAAEMAWSIRKNRTNRTSKEMAYHVLEILCGMSESAKKESVYKVKSTFELPKALPSGYIDNGFWGPNEESSLV